LESKKNPSPTLSLQRETPNFSPFRKAYLPVDKPACRLGMGGLKGVFFPNESPLEKACLPTRHGEYPEGGICISLENSNMEKLCYYKHIDNKFFRELYIINYT